MAFRIEKQTAAHDQVLRQMQNLLATGTWKPGMRLPTTQQLATDWGTYPLAVHHAYGHLVRRGLLVRRRGHGTFVHESAPARRLACVGLYYPGDILTQPDRHMTRAVHQALLRRFAARKLDYRVFTDHRPEAEQTRVWPELRQVADRREIDALLTPVVDGRHWQWLSKLPLPVACCSTGVMPNRVTEDLSGFMDLAVAQLVSQGCRSLGLIAPISAAARQPDGSQHPDRAFFLRFLERTRQAGLTVRDDWIIAPRGVHDLYRQDISHERYGYDAFAALWQQDQRPEGLVVYPDSVVRGVVLALTANGVRVPEQLKLAFHKNEEVDLLRPFSASYIVLSARQVAQSLLEVVEAFHAGKKVEPQIVPYRLQSV